VVWSIGNGRKEEVPLSRQKEKHKKRNSFPPMCVCVCVCVCACVCVFCVCDSTRYDIKDRCKTKRTGDLQSLMSQCGLVIPYFMFFLPLFLYYDINVREYLLECTVLRLHPVTNRRLWQNRLTCPTTVHLCLKREIGGKMWKGVCVSVCGERQRLKLEDYSTLSDRVE
jgi:hypothetical protein